MTDIATLGAGLPLVAVVVPALAALIVYCLTDPTARDRVVLGGVLVTAGLVTMMLPAASRGEILSFDAGLVAPNIPLALTADPLGVAFAGFIALVYLLSIPVIVFQHRTQSVGPGTREYACLLASQAAAIGAALAGNLLLLFVALELLTLLTYPLLADGEDRRSRRAGYAYLTYGFTGGLAVLIATRLVYAEAGMVTFVEAGIPALVGAGEPWGLRAAAILFVLGFGVKAAVVPLHSWLVRARVASTPVLGTVFVAIITTTGVFGLVRVVRDIFGTATFGTLGVTPLLLGLASVSALIGGALAIGSDRFRDRLVYLAVAASAFPLLSVAVPEVHVLAAVGVAGGHVLFLLIGFLALSLLESEETPLHVHTASPVLWIASTTLVGGVLLVGMWYRYSIGVRTAPVVTAILLVVALVHLITLQPIVCRLVPGPSSEIERINHLVPGERSAIGRIAGQSRSVGTVIGAQMDRVAIAAMTGVRHPERAIEAVLPRTIHGRYQHIRDRRPGRTGTKLRIEDSIYVVAVVLAIVLILGLQ